MAENLLLSKDYTFEEVNINIYTINKHTVTKMATNNIYSIKMFCKKCDDYMSNYFCECYTNVHEKNYCRHIHLMVLLKKPMQNRAEPTKVKNSNRIAAPVTNVSIISQSEKLSEKINNITSRIEKKFKMMTASFIENNDIESAKKLEYQLDLLQCMVTIQTNGPTHDFKTIKNSRNKKVTQRKDFVPACFKRTKK